MNRDEILKILIEVGTAVCDKVYDSIRKQSIESLSSVHEEGLDDTIYQIDKDVEDIIVPILRNHASSIGGIVLIAEGIGNEDSPLLLPEGIKEEDAKVRIICDPIDGTRGIMYDKRSAFFLAAATSNVKGRNSTLQDLEVSVMTELPTSKQYCSDTFYATKGKGAHGFTRNLFTNEIKTKMPCPSKATSIKGGFGQISRFFPPGKKILAEIEDELIEKIFPNHDHKKAILFEDQYISSGGQLYEMLVGHDRFVAELRRGLYFKLTNEGKSGGHCCHPYDLCAHLIGTEAGIIITDKSGNPLNAPLDTTTSVDWIGYANKNIQQELETTLKSLIKDYGLADDK